MFIIRGIFEDISNVKGIVAFFVNHMGIFEDSVNAKGIFDVFPY